MLIYAFPYLLINKKGAKGGLQRLTRKKERSGRRGRVWVGGEGGGWEGEGVGERALGRGEAGPIIIEVGIVHHAV